MVITKSFVSDRTPNVPTRISCVLSGSSNVAAIGRSMWMARMSMIAPGGAVKSAVG